MSDPERGPDAAPESPELRPEDFARSSDLTGQAITALGGEWYVKHAGLAPIVAEVRDRIFQHATLKSTIDIADARLVCYYGLHANYLMGDDQVARVLFDAAPSEVAGAAMESLFGQTSRRTYTSWATSALLAAGLKPADIPAEYLGLVLRHLAKTSRIEDRDTFTEAGEYMGIRASLLTMGKD